MTEGPDPRDDGFGSELRRRQTPELARQQRLRAVRAGLFGVVMGSVILLEGAAATRSGQEIHFGRVGWYLVLPGWVVALAGLFILFVSGWVLWRFARRGRARELGLRK